MLLNSGGSSTFSLTAVGATLIDSRCVSSKATTNPPHATPTHPPPPCHDAVGSERSRNPLPANKFADDDGDSATVGFMPRSSENTAVAPVSAANSTVGSKRTRTVDEMFSELIGTVNAMSNELRTVSSEVRTLDAKFDALDAKVNLNAAKTFIASSGLDP